MSFLKIGTEQKLRSLAEERCPTCGGEKCIETDRSSFVWGSDAWDGAGNPITDYPDCPDCRNEAGEATGFRNWKLRDACGGERTFFGVAPCRRKASCECQGTGYTLPPPLELVGVLMEILKGKISIAILNPWYINEMTLADALADALAASRGLETRARAEGEE